MKRKSITLVTTEAATTPTGRSRLVKLRQRKSNSDRRSVFPHHQMLQKQISQEMAARRATRGQMPIIEQHQARPGSNPRDLSSPSTPALARHRHTRSYGDYQRLPEAASPLAAMKPFHELEHGCPSLALTASCLASVSVHSYFPPPLSLALPTIAVENSPCLCSEARPPLRHERHPEPAVFPFWKHSSLFFKADIRSRTLASASCRLSVNSYIYLSSSQLDRLGPINECHAIKSSTIVASTPSSPGLLGR